MELANLIQQYAPALMTTYADNILPSHRRALDAMLACRRSCGELTLHCPSCHTYNTVPLSCGHRHCPKCQKQDTTAWIERQCKKLLPVPYFMVTFTLPEQLRTIAWHHQRLIYNLLFSTAVKTLKTLGMDSRHLGAKLGMTGVLHTHTRRLEYHPHIHFIIPGGGLYYHKKRQAFKRLDGDFFIHGDVIAKMFRGKFMYGLLEHGFTLPPRLPKKWVVNVKAMGRGKPAIKYLARYLYRGVISEQRIVKNEDGNISFTYTDSQTNRQQVRTLKAEEFLWKVLTHVLPRGFRRVRDYGFLHPNGKKRLVLVQLLLSVRLSKDIVKRKVQPRCSECGNVTNIVDIKPKKIPISPLFTYSRE